MRRFTNVLLMIPISLFAVLIGSSGCYNALVSAFQPVRTLRGLPCAQHTWRDAHFFFSKTATHLSSTSVPVENDHKATAVSALMKLRRRQIAELEETERLLKVVEFADEEGQNLFEIEGATTDDDDHSSSNTAKNPLSTAVSILSGFDYGFASRSEGAKSSLTSGVAGLVGDLYGGPPPNLYKLGSQQFVRNLDAMKGEYRDEEDVDLSPTQRELRSKLEQLTLNSTEIWEREFADGPIQAPWVIKIPYLAVCYLLDEVFEGKYVPARFFLLETVARMPYFSYITMLHLYETLGFWRRSSDVKRIHFAEEINEFNHLLIMESLGGDQDWWVRFLAQHSAIAYYVVLCLLFALSPTLSYRFSELLETHAVNTYGVFLDENEALLRELPPSLAAVEYYALSSADPFYGEFQTTAISKGGTIRRPGHNMRSLYHVFKAIRADEGDHVSTMQACLDPEASLQSPSLERKLLMGVAFAATVALVVQSGVVGDLDSVGGTGGLDTLVDDLTNVATSVADGSGLDVIVDGFIAGLAGLAAQLQGNEEEVAIGEEMLEAGVVGSIPGALEGLGQAFTSFLGSIIRFLMLI